MRPNPIADAINFLSGSALFYVFALLVIASLLITGTAVRLSGIIGAAMAINLWLGLYSTHGEWPWTYFFLIVVQLMFALNRAGRSLGVDALIVHRLREASTQWGWRSRILAMVT